jgi:nucleoside-diphosphate-sugar epimerase
MDSNHAIIFGASGVIGWALVNQLLGPYPDAGAFSKVTAITNRPLNLSETCWPESNSQRPDLQLVSGVDLRQGDGTTLADTLKRTVKDVESVTHIYYLGMSPLKYHEVQNSSPEVFTAVDDISEEVATNRKMFKNVIDAHSLISPKLKFVTFPGGTRVSIQAIHINRMLMKQGYGTYAPGGTFTPPLHEEMVNDLPVDYAKTVVYTEYRKLLDAASKGKNWTWCEVCPDAIVSLLQQLSGLN